MESRAQLFGHPIHPMLIPFPLELLATSLAFALVHLLAGGEPWAELAYWMIAAGIIGSLAAAPAGWIDRFAIPAGTRAKAIGLALAFSTWRSLARDYGLPDETAADLLTAMIVSSVREDVPACA